MQTKNVFKPAMLTLAVAAAVQPIYAGAQEQEEKVMEEVVVTGIQAALQRAQAVKMDSKGITEALSAEDIGKLPDSSIAESLARLPGLAGERVNGRVSGISVRGFKEDFTGTTLNGRELIGIGDNRGVEYDLYPAEIMTGATVYKSSNASLMVQGIGGTVDLQTVRPLDAENTITANYTYEMNERTADNPDVDDTGERYALSFVQSFADDKVGLAVTLANTETPNNQRKYGVWGYGDNGDGQLLPFGLDANVQGTVLKRETISTILQFRPSDRLDVVVDYLDIDYSDSGVLRGFIEPFSSANVTGSGANSTGTQVGANPVLRTDPLNKEGNLKARGLNVNFKITDSLTAMFDYGNSTSSKFDQRAESYAGLGRSGSLATTIGGTRDFTMTPDGISFNGSTGLEAFSDPSLLQLTGPQEWGGGMASIGDRFETDVLKANGSPYSYLNAQDGFNNFATFSEDLETYRFELNQAFEDSIVTNVKVGYYYSDRYKDKLNTGQFATAYSYPYSSGIPSGYVVGLANMDWMGLGQVVAYDGNKPYADGTYQLNLATFLEPDRLGDSYTVEEQVDTFYAQIDFETELAGMPFFGNVGVQYIQTDQSSTGWVGVAGDNGRTCDADSNNEADLSCYTEFSTSYNNTLPSLNLNLEVADGQFVRFSYSTTISRPRIDQMKAGGFVKFDQNLDLISIPNSVEAVELYGSPWSKTAGNPDLRPLESNNFDLSYENYFSDRGYVSVAGFYKDIDNWTRQGNAIIDFTNDATNGGANYFVPGFHDRVVQEDGLYGPLDTFYAAGDLMTPPNYGVYDTFEDGLTGTISGFEVTANIPFGDFADMLEGFGIAGSAMMLEDFQLDDGSDIPGMSDEVYSLQAYYENDGFEVRVALTDRSEFLTYERGGSNKIATATRAGYQLLDAQISYDFAGWDNEWLSGLRVSLQGRNLTDEEEETIDSNGIVTTRRSFGATYLFNVNYSFYN